MSLARLKSGVTHAQAQANMTAVAQRLETAYPDFDANWTVNVAPLVSRRVGWLTSSRRRRR